MAPSAPITLPAPVPAPAFVNGHALGSAQKVPGKSNLKQTSTIPSTSSNGASSTDVRFGESHEDGERAQGESERGTKVQWIDNYGKELTQVFEFEPSSDSDDSDDSDDDSDSSQSCTCVIQ
jgi:hypothetical protein